MGKTRSTKQRKAMFANMNKGNSDLRPLIFRNAKPKPLGSRATKAVISTARKTSKRLDKQLK